MAEKLTPTVLVVGAGPGGYVAAEKCGQMGLDTIIVDADRLGGTCLLRGCIPSKALIHAASLYAGMCEKARGSRLGIRLSSQPTLDIGETVRWKDDVVDRLNSGVAGLLRRARVRVVEGHARFTDAKRCIVTTSQGELVIEPRHVILATGSRPSSLPGLPFGGNLISSDQALSPDRLPDRLAIVGAGYIGLELGTAYAKLGVAVTIVETAEQILPLYDAPLVEPVRRWLEKNGVELVVGAKATGADDTGLMIETSEGTVHTIPADQILVTVGRQPNIDGWGREEMALAMDGRFVRVDDQCSTSVRGVYAIGDLVGEPMLAHKASAQGEMVAEIIAGRRRKWDPVAIPAVCFTEPEIVSVGAAPSGDSDSISASFPFKANGRALAMGIDDDEGFVRIVARKTDQRLLGVQAVGPHVAELVHHFTALLEMGAVLEDVVGMVHAHPTLGEALHEAATLARARATA